MPKKRVKTEIVYLPYTEPRGPKRADFPRMPILYLELLENKSKIRKDIRNVEYIPPEYQGRNEKDFGDPRLSARDKIPKKSNSSSYSKIRENMKNRGSRSDRASDDEMFDGSDEDISDDDIPEGSDGDLSEDQDDGSNHGSDNEYESDGDMSDDSSDYAPKKWEKRRSGSDRDKRRSGSDRVDNSDSEFSDDSDNSGSDSDSEDERYDNRQAARREKERALADFLGDGRGDKKNRVGRNQSKESERLKKESYQSNKEKFVDLPPTLGELRRRNHQNKYERLAKTTRTVEESEDDRRKLLQKYNIYKDNFPDYKFPELSIHTPATKIQNTLDEMLQLIAVDNNVEKYEKITLGSCLFMEILAGDVFNLPAKGFTIREANNMNQYKQLLLEMAQKSYIPVKSSLPVEVRLFGLIFVNLAVYTLFQLAMTKLSQAGNPSGDFSILDSIQDVFGLRKNQPTQPGNIFDSGPNAPASQMGNDNAEPQRKSKIDGPTISLDDLDLDED